MLPTYHTTMKSCNCHCCIVARATSRLFSLLLKLSWTINCLSLAHKAYLHRDYSMVTFVFFAYFGFLALELCRAAFSKLPRNEGDSSRKYVLKIAIWVLYVFLVVGFTYQVGRAFPFGTSLLLFAVLSVLSALSCYELFTHQGDHMKAKLRTRTCSRPRDYSRSRFVNCEVRDGCIECIIRIFGS